MTLEEIKTALKATGYQVAYRAFKSKQAPPFICYLFNASADFVADDSNYYQLSDIDIELYTDKKDPDAEAALETQLRVTGLVWSKSETYIETEKLHEVIYSIRA